MSGKGKQKVTSENESAESSDDEEQKRMEVPSSKRKVATGSRAVSRSGMQKSDSRLKKRARCPIPAQFFKKLLANANDVASGDDLRGFAELETP